MTNVMVIILLNLFSQPVILMTTAVCLPVAVKVLMASVPSAPASISSPKVTRKLTRDLNCKL